MTTLLKKLQLVCEGAFDLAHENPKWIWWYDSGSERMECYSPDVVYGHQDPKFNDIQKNAKGQLIKGRMFEYEGKNILMIYHNRYHGSFPKDILSKILQKLYLISKSSIDEIVDDHGYEIQERLINV